MKLNISCVRNILLTVEKNETLLAPVRFDDIEFAYYDDFLSEYTIGEILYHIQYCIKAGLLSDVSSTMTWYKTSFDCCLEPSGHDFLANTRSAEKWSHTQAIFSKIGGASLKVMSAIAEGVTTALANKYLPDEVAKIIS